MKMPIQYEKVHEYGSSMIQRAQKCAQKSKLIIKGMTGVERAVVEFENRVRQKYFQRS